MKSFPSPLTAEEENRIVQKYVEGDECAKKILIEKNLRLVTHVLKKYQQLDVDQDDLISIGTIGLIKAINTFDPSKNAKLATYACRCIENEILMMLRSRKKTSRETSLFDPIGTDHDGNEICLYDILESDDEDIFSSVLLHDNIHFLYKILETELTKRESAVIVMRYGLYNSDRMTQKEVAERLHISRSYVSRIEKACLEKFRVLFSHMME